MKHAEFVLDRDRSNVCVIKNIYDGLFVTVLSPVANIITHTVTHTHIYR